MQTHDHHSLNDTHVSDKKGSSVFSLPSVQIILVVLVFLAGFTVVKLYNRSDTPDLDLSGKGVGGQTCEYKWTVRPITTPSITPTPSTPPPPPPEDCPKGRWATDLGLIEGKGQVKYAQGLPYFDPDGTGFSVNVPVNSKATTVSCYDCDHNDNNPSLGGWQISWNGGSFVAITKNNEWGFWPVSIGGLNKIAFDGGGDSHGGNVCVETPEVTTCENCDYQVDAFWGPVIKSFKENGRTFRYHGSSASKMRLLASSKSMGRSVTDNNKFPSCTVGDDLVPNDGDPNVKDFPCDRSNPMDYLNADLDTSHVAIANGGYASTTITNTHSSCEYSVGFASYRMDSTLGDPDIYNTQEYIEHQETTLGPSESITLYARVAVLDENEDQCIDLPN